MALLSLDQARGRLLDRAPLVDVERVGLGEAAGRVLGEPRVLAALDVPGFDNSAMDGFAVRVADTPGHLRLVGEIAAGMAVLPTIEPGTTARIMTGAPMPAGADAVVPIEEADEHGDRVQVAEARPGAHVRTAGHDTRRGDEVCLPGELAPAAIAVLASLGVGDVMVRRRPVVAVLSTGDELADVGAPLGPHQVYDANGVALAAAVREAGAEALLLRRVGDDAAEIERALTDAAARADLLVTSAGVSVGRHDHVRAVLESAGSLDFWRVAVQPGKPLAVGEIAGATLIGLPGNPVSALVTFELFVRPFIRAMLGLEGDGRLHLAASPTEPMRKDEARRAFLRVELRLEDGRIEARPAGGQQSSQLRPLASANALLVVPEGVEAAEPGRTYDAVVIAPLAGGAR